MKLPKQSRYRNRSMATGVCRAISFLITSSSVGGDKTLFLQKQIIIHYESYGNLAGTKSYHNQRIMRVNKQQLVGHVFFEGRKKKTVPKKINTNSPGGNCSIN